MPKGYSLRAGFFQFAPVFGEVKQNVEYVLDRLQNVAADLIVLPELFASGYQFASKREVAGLSEEVPSGFTTRRLTELSGDRRLYLVAGLPERSESRFYNSAVLVGPQGYVATYRKAHLFDEEKRWFHPGNTGFRVHRIGRARLGIMICFDWIFPEAARSLALAGADIIAHPSNLVLPHCPDAMVTRCIENRVFAITANRVGSERRGGRKQLTYIGRSEVVDPKGRILVRASSAKEELRVAEIQPQEAQDKRITRRNHLLRDRRTELYTNRLSMPLKH
jgi:predicted amidohydrolase